MEKLFRLEFGPILWSYMLTGGPLWLDQMDFISGVGFWALQLLCQLLLYLLILPYYQILQASFYDLYVKNHEILTVQQKLW